jgi:hypothetical protein
MEIISGYSINEFAAITGIFFLMIENEENLTKSKEFIAQKLQSFELHIMALNN